MSKVQYKVKKVTVDGQNKFIPIRKKTVFGIGVWRECEEWSTVEKQLNGERNIGLETDSTLTVIRSFIDDRPDVELENDYYNS